MNPEARSRSAAPPSTPESTPLAHIAAQCQSSDCGLRFPISVGHARSGECPLCQSPTSQVAEYPPPYPPPPSPPQSGETIAVLDNVRSALNVGTMLRAADGADISHVHLCGVTPRADHPKVAKTSLGAERTIAWTSHPDAVECVRSLADQGWTIWAVESSPNASPFHLLASAPARVAMVVGNERAGVDPDVLALADRVVALPMAGAKTTLNVGVAFGVVAYGIRRMRSEIAESD